MSTPLTKDALGSQTIAKHKRNEDIPLTDDVVSSRRIDDKR